MWYTYHEKISSNIKITNIFVVFLSDHIKLKYLNITCTQLLSEVPPLRAQSCSFSLISRSSSICSRTIEQVKLSTLLALVHNRIYYSPDI